MTDKPDGLRDYLDKIAANAGDPPEHGLDGVLARRRRRTRHRRGAVATAMALAVFGVVALPWLTGQQRDHDVTAASPTGSPGQQAEMPDIVELFCSRGAIDVPVASIRPRPDGMHLDVLNDLGTPTEVWVVADSSPVWSSGRFTVAGGTSSVVLAAPPGPLTVGCDTGGADQQRQVDLVDVDRHYDEPGLSCPEDEHGSLDQAFEVVAPTSSPLPEVARDALGEERIPYSDQMKVHTGYEDGDATWDSPTADPVVQVIRDGETVALVHVSGADGASGVGAAAEASADDPASIPPTPEQPWSGVPLVEHCPAFDSLPESPGGPAGAS